MVKTHGFFQAFSLSESKEQVQALFNHRGKQETKVWSISYSAKGHQFITSY